MIPKSIILHSTMSITKPPTLLHKLKSIWQRFSSSFVNRLLLKFIGLMGLFYIMWASPIFQKTIVPFIAQLYAKIGNFVLNILGYQVKCHQDVITSQEFSIGIQNGCDGIEGLAIYLCAVVIYPASLSQKAKGILWGSLFLILLNLLRIVSLYMIGLHLPSIFDIMHESIWQILFIVLTLVVLFIWVDWLNRAIPSSKN